MKGNEKQSPVGNSFIGRAEYEESSQVRLFSLIGLFLLFRCVIRILMASRRLIMDGPLLLTRVVRKAMVSFEAINGQGDASTVQVDCLAPELTPRPLVGILCNDLLVLCRDPSEGHDSAASVDLWAVLRMQTLPQPASIVHGNGERFT